jgi:hypothetical protein
MTLSIAWSTSLSTITVPKSDLTQPGASTSFFTYDTSAQFWAEVKAAEASEIGIVFSDIVDRNAPYTIGGVVYAPKVEVLSNAQVQFEDADYTVVLEGSNNNIWDKESGILIKNDVLPVSGNSAGLQLVQTDVSGLTTSESADLAMLRKAFLNAQHLLEGSTANFKIWDDGADPNVDPPLWTQDVTDKDGNPIVLPIGSPAQRSEVST